MFYFVYKLGELIHNNIVKIKEKINKEHKGYAKILKNLIFSFSLINVIPIGFFVYSSIHIYIYLFI